MPEEQHDGTPDRHDPFGIESGAPQTDRIHTTHGVGPIHDAERRHVSTGARQPAQKRQRSDPYVLMHDTVAGHERPIVELDMTRGRAPPATMVPLPMRQLWATWAFCMK